MTDWMGVILKRHGQTAAVVTTDGEEMLKAFIQPVTEKSERVPGDVSELGYLDERLWLYLGKREIKPEESLRWNGMEFQVRSSRPYYIGGVLMYWWAALEPAKEAAG